MSILNEDIVKETEQYVRDLYDKKLPDKILFHTLHHTYNVLKQAEIIGDYCNLKKHEITILKIAALFHDVGYINTYSKHEEESVRIASEFLLKKGVDKKWIKQIENCILSTQTPQKPKTNFEEILCDADMIHLASNDYFEQAELLRLEWEKTKGKNYKKSLFYINSIDFFNKHTYHTEYGKSILQAKKEKNLDLIFKKIKNSKSKKIRNGVDYSRGVETMFRLTARNQINLSSIADNKSNILISINAIIISVVISILIGKFEENPKFIFPTLIFLLSCLTTIVFAILSTRPNITWGNYSLKEIREKKIDLLFFGNFSKMKYENYEKAVEEMIQNDIFLYSTMIKNQYHIGKILAKKFKLLTIAYNFFMYGIVFSVIAFLISFIRI